MPIPTINEVAKLPYLITNLCFIAIIKAAGEEKGSSLDTLLRTEQDKLNYDCYEKALKVAVEKNKVLNAEKLILAGAKNIDKVIKSAKQVDVQLMLLMVKAVLGDDYHLINEIRNILGKALKKNETPLERSDETVPPHSADSDHHNRDILYTEEMTEHIIGGRLRTRVPIKLAIKLNKPERMIDELLLITNINCNVGSVGWNNLNLAKVDIKWIKNLPRHMMIKHLNLSQNQLNTLPVGIAFHLRKCTKLDLHKNNMGNVPPIILQLPMLKELNLSNNKISKLPNVSWSASLVQLNLSYNELKTLPDDVTEQCAGSMKVLRLEHNQLRKVPQCACFLRNLNTLDLSYNPEILVLPVDLGRLKELKQLTLGGLHHLYDPPPSICEDSAVCISYLKSQFLRQIKYYRMKLMLVGKQKVGKTTIVGCLQGKKYPEESTIGVDIGEWAYSPSLFKSTFYFSVWDFAGQKEYYATHQVFLSKRSLYLAVWNVMDGKDGITELKSWLNNIIVRAPESRIIIVGTHLDELIRQNGRENAEAQCAEYEEHFTNAIIQHDHIKKNVVRIMFVGLKGKRVNVSVLKEEIYKAAEKCRSDNDTPIMGCNIPASYNKVDNMIIKSSKSHEPILHATQFKGMVVSLGQPDLQSDDEIRALTLFLHDIGSLLHFDDHRHNLDDLYFVKPQWLCKLMSTVITVKERNDRVKDGKIDKPNLEELFQRADNNAYPERYLEQYLVLFNRFEIALPLDKEGDQLLIPCFLPSERPKGINGSLNGCHHQRIFGFQDVTTPPGLWSRLLSRLMNTVSVVTDLLDNNRTGDLSYWKKGLHCHSGDIQFIIESCRSQGEDDGISILYSSEVAQQGLLGELVNLVQQIVSEWFPGLVKQLEQIFICYECAKENHQTTYKLAQLLKCIAEGKLRCEVCQTDIELKTLAPDLLLDDMSEGSLLEFESIQIQQDEDLIWTGKFGKVYHGTKVDSKVIVKLYGTDEDSNLEGYEVLFQHFRAEVTYLQRIKHVCLVGMVGVCKYPNLALVMEDGPMGSLDSCLLKELREVPRIVVYRIAAQITSALRFLHSIPVIYRGLTTSNILVWSLSLDDLVNCKLTGSEITAYAGLGHAETSFTDKLIAPEVSKQAIYDKRVDIFSLGVVFLQMLQRSYPTEHRELPEWEMPQMFKSVPAPDSELYHFGNLAKGCCNHDPANRPGLPEIVEQLCDPEFQLVMDVTATDGEIGCACTGCVRYVDTSAAASHTDHISEAWISCQCGDGSEIIGLTLKDLKLETEKRLFIKDHQIYTMLSHDNHVWATSMQAGCEGSLLKFDSNMKDDYIVVPIKKKVTEDGDTLPDGDYGISLVCSGDCVYVGTVGGWCLMFPTNVNKDTIPIREVKLSCNFIRSLIVVKETSLLWASTILHAGDQILFVNLPDLEFNQDRKGANVDNYRVGNLLLSPDEGIVWTVHINGHSISAWSARKRELIYPFNSHKLLDEKVDLQKSRIVSASVVLDTLWVGLVSGHILTVTATLPQRALIIMKPYDQMVQALFPIYGKDNNNTMMVSIGKDYLLEKRPKGKKQKSLDVVLWEAVSAKRMIQIKHLSTGNAWLNDASLNEVRLIILLAIQVV